MRSDKTLREEAKIEEWLGRHFSRISWWVSHQRTSWYVDWGRWNEMQDTGPWRTKLAALREAKRIIEAEERNK